jgi:glucose-1-phosphate adenylyltransferase
LSILTMILAGGTGKELSVLTKHRAKTALPFGGRYRIIDFVLSNCVHSGITDISILAQYSPKSLIYHIGMGKPWDLDRKKGGVFILQPTHRGRVANWYQGTAAALYQNIDTIRDSEADHVLVLSGDQVYVMDYREMLKKHMSSGSGVTIAIKEVSPSQRSRFGMIGCTPEGTVTDFEEKPASSSFRYASLGIYLFEKKLLLDSLHSDRLDIVFDIIIPLLETGMVSCYELDGYWEDIGSLRSYFSASMRLLNNRSLLSSQGWPIYTRGSNLPPARIAAGSRVVDSILADGCVVEGEVSGSILSPGVRIDKGARVEESIVFSFSRIGQGAHVSKAIIDKHCSIGAGSIVGFDARESVVEGVERKIEGLSRISTKLAVLGKGAIIRRGEMIPSGITIEPRYKPGRMESE